MNGGFVHSDSVLAHLLVVRPYALWITSYVRVLWQLAYWSDNRLWYVLCSSDEVCRN